MNDKEIIAIISRGNPGCMQFLVELMHLTNGRAEVQTLMKLGMGGSRTYQFWNDCCDRNTNDAAEVLSYLEAGRISYWEFKDHVSGLTGKKFDMEELRSRTGGGYLKKRHGLTMLKRTPEGTCEMCATAHDPNMPHNLQSLTYQYNFYDKEGRWPTWRDAMAHCTPEMQQAWTEALKERGVKVE